MAQLRLRSVKFKNGGAEVRVLRGRDNTDRERIERDIAKVLDYQTADNPKIGGMAIVVWGEDSASTCHFVVNEGSQIPSSMVPDFLRNRVLLEISRHWACEDRG